MLTTADSAMIALRSVTLLAALQGTTAYAVGAGPARMLSRSAMLRGGAKMLAEVRAWVRYTRRAVAREWRASSLARTGRTRLPCGRRAMRCPARSS